MRKRIVALLSVLLLAVGLGIAPSSGLAEPSAKPNLQLPTPPLSASALSQTSVLLDWNPYGNNGQTGFIIERSTGGGPWGLIHTALAGDRTYTDSGLSCGTTYDYRIAATSALINSPWGTDSATTDSCSSPTTSPGPRNTPAPPPPPPPRGAEIQLRTEIGAAGVPPEQLWTKVQHQVGGQWEDVDGWQGTLDEVIGATGLKSWWAGEELLGAGPFRWVVYEREGGRALAQSAQFNVPEENWDTEIVRVVVPAASVGSIPFTGLARPIVFIGGLGIVLAVVALGVAAMRRRLTKQKPTR